MEESFQGPSTPTNVIWRRLATPREALFGLRTDGTIRSICSSIEILSSVEIEQELLEICAEHFNRDLGCFHEFLMENEESKDIWLVETKENNYVVEEMEDDDIIDLITIEEEINCRYRCEDMPTWKLYYCYTGFDYDGNEESILPEKYPLVYQLLFVFSTGTLDEFSCALICDLFLNILDCALKEAPFHCYSHLKMYDVGSKLESKVNEAIQGMIQDPEYKKYSRKAFKKFRDPCSNFDFQKKEYENKDKTFRTRRCFISREDTEAFISICKTKDIGIYAVFIVIINNLLFHHAVKNGFKGIFRARVLNIINSRFLLNKDDKKYTYKLGSYSLPYKQNFKLESTEVEEIFKEAPFVENELERVTMKKMFWDQEALRELCIKASGKKHNSGKWNPHYCFSITNMGNLDCFYVPENPNNKIQLLSYERAGSALEGGNLDVIFHIFSGRLTVYFDFSNEYFNNDEISSIIETFKNVIKSII